MAKAKVENGPVVDHAQAFADEIDKRFGAVSKTYPGHSPSQPRALDIWDTGPDLDAVANYAVATRDRFGIMYVIWRQRIYNPSVALWWRDMEDRGSPTNNHLDHVHVSFLTGVFEGSTEEDELTPEQNARLTYVEDLCKAMSVELAKLADVIRGQDGIAEDVDRILRDAQSV